MNRTKVAAWFVHAYTALGLACAAGAYFSLEHRNGAPLFFWLAAAVVIDSTDGLLARKFRVAEMLPNFDGRKLDDIVDYLTYVFLPVLAIWEWELLPKGLGWVGVLPLIASGYGFSQENAKTEDSFVGFPSYWNVVVFYMVALGWKGGGVAAGLIVLSVLVFVPIHFIYPTRAKWLMPLTLGLATAWGVLNVFVLVTLGTPIGKQLAGISLFFPLYYVVISTLHHLRTKAGERGSSAG